MCSCPIFRSYSPLLNANQAGHIHRFAAESFAFLVRKSKNLPDLFNYILLHVLKTPHVIPGVGMLFAETVRGVQNQFHSCTENVVTVLLGKLAPDAQFDENLEQGQKVSIYTRKNLTSCQQVVFATSCNKLVNKL